VPQEHAATAPAEGRSWRSASAVTGIPSEEKSLHSRPSTTCAGSRRALRARTRHAIRAPAACGRRSGERRGEVTAGYVSSSSSGHPRDANSLQALPSHHFIIRSPLLPRTKSAMRSVPQRHAATDPESGTERFAPATSSTGIPSDSKPLHSTPSRKVWRSSPVCPVAKTSTRSETEPQAAGAPSVRGGSRPRHPTSRELPGHRRNPSSLRRRSCGAGRRPDSGQTHRSALRPGCRRRAASPRAAARKARPFARPESRATGARSSPRLPIPS